MTEIFCEIFYFLTNITYNVILTDRTIFPIPISALFPTTLLLSIALVSLAWLVLCVLGPCAVSPHRYTRTGSLLGA